MRETLLQFLKASLVIVIPAVVTAILLLPTAGHSQGLSTETSATLEEFKLHASVIETLDGLRDINLQSNTLGTLSQDGLGQGVGLPLSQEKETGKDVLKAGESHTASIDIPVPGKPMAGKAESAVSKIETGVDWSSWASTLADRWFANLKNMEYRTRKAFRTKKPALIQFTCFRDGRIGRIVLRQSCGVPEYDNMQIESLKRCMPLHPFPEGSRRTSYSLVQGWDAHPRKPGESDFKPGSYGKNFPVERISVRKKIK